MIGALLFPLLLSAAASAPISCPTNEDLTHCTCKRVAYGLHVVCAQFNSSSILQKDFRILRDYAVQTVLLYKLYFTEDLPSDIFDGMKIKEITIEKCQLKFKQPAFTGLDHTLFKLNVAEDTLIKSKDNNQFLGKFSLAKLSNLNELYVKKNKLLRISDAWLNNKLPNVKKVMLDENEIANIESHAFASLTHLKILSLAENRIKSVQRSMIPNPAIELTRIDLSFNEIETLPNDFFLGMPNLKEVVLTQNSLKVLEEKTWEPIWENLKLVLLYENPIECGAPLQWIRRRHRPVSFQGFCHTPAEMEGKPVEEMYKSGRK